MVTCESCGAEFEEALVRCPYCGSGNANAEETEYMQQMEEIRTELESHKKDGDVQLKKGLGKVARTLLLAAAVIVILLLTGWGLSYRSEQKERKERKEAFLVEQGNDEQQEKQVDSAK